MRNSSGAALGVGFLAIICCGAPLLFAGVDAATAAGVLGFVHARPTLVATIAILAVVLIGFFVVRARLR